MFHTFYQINSGGYFDFDEEKGITHYVIVEGEDIEEIIYRAGRIGLYFDGNGDCRCCGNRWTKPWGQNELTEKPKVYGIEVGRDEPFKGCSMWMKDGKEGCIHYLDKTKEWFGVIKKS